MDPLARELPAHTVGDGSSAPGQPHHPGEPVHQEVIPLREDALHQIPFHRFRVGRILEQKVKLGSEGLETQGCRDAGRQLPPRDQ